VKALVLDGSFALSVLLQDEFSAAALRALSVVRTIPAESRFVPSHFWIEVTNALLMAERRKRVSQADMAQSLQLAFALPVVTDDETSHRCPKDTLALAREFRLTIYDAAYLELAIRRGAGLATLDKALARAAAAAGVEIAA
jgi:predicted nucleic acid-binding protein